MATIESWNERYRAGEPDAEPAELLVKTMRHAPPGRALDLACGAGRNSIWLARRGWDVVALDGASEAIRILRSRAGALPIDARVCDLETHEPLPFPDESFDAVLIFYFLWRPLFAEAKRLVKPGGRVIAAIRTRGSYAMRPSELGREFLGWTFEHCDNGEIAEVVVRKP